MADDSFKAQLKAYRAAINADIAAYSAHARSASHDHYGTQAGKVTAAFLDVLEGNGKRLRGTLAMVGYEMLGGQDRAMILRAATAMEMLHTHMLIIDDIQDRSKLRRGEPALHVTLVERLGNGDAHTGVSLALNAAIGGGHAAQMLLAGLRVEPELNRKVLGIVNYTLAVATHGQTYDILYSRPEAQPTEADLERVLHWKTAEYTFLNPLCVGMVLAGAPCEDTNAIRDYALHAGKAFQIMDDVQGVFGDSSVSGKEGGEDIREGKATLLTVYALEHAEKIDRAFLEKSLGKADLTVAELKRCQSIIKNSGAYEHALVVARQHAADARQSLHNTDRPWKPTHVAFLDALVAPHLLQ